MAHVYLTTFRLLFVSFLISGCGIQAQIQSLLSKTTTSALTINNKVPFVVANSLNYTSFDLSGSCNSENSTVEVKINGTSYGSTICDGEEWSKNIDLSSLPDSNNHSLEVSITKVGTSSPFTSETAVLLKDIIPPVVLGVDDVLLPTNSQVTSWSCSDANLPCSYRYQITNNPGFIFLTESYYAVSSATINQKGLQYLYVQAVDLAGNPSSTVQADHYIGSPRIYVEGVNAVDTDLSNVSLQILAVPSLVEMAIFNNSTCSGPANWTTTTANVPSWSLDPAHQGGIATVGVKFRTATLQETGCYSDTINWVSRTESIMCTNSSATSSTGRLVDSGGLSGNHGNDESCTFNLNLPGTPTRITIQNIDLEDEQDYLEVWINGTWMTSYTGAVLSQSFTTSSNQVSFEFFSNSSITKQGFVLTWAPVSSDQPEFKINDGDDYSFGDTVTAAMPVDSSLTEYYLTETSGCGTGGTWQTLSPTRTWTFSDPSEGVRSLFVKFRNAFNEETSCEGDSIIIKYPSLSLDSHSNGDYVGSNFTLSGSCAPNTSLVELTHAAGTTSTICLGESWTIASTTSIADGSNLSPSIRLIYNSNTLLTINPSLLVWKTPPTAVISGLPTGASTVASFTATISGTNVSNYRYKYGPGIDCTDSAGYSSSASTAATVNVNQSAFPAGPVTFCAIGRSSVNGSWQSFASASSVTWTKELPIEVNFVGPHEVLSEGQSGVQLQVTIPATQATNTRIYYNFVGDALYMIDHNLAAGYIDIPAGQTIGSISFSTFSDALLNGDRELRVYISHGNSSSLEVGKRHMKIYTIKDDDQTFMTIDGFSFFRYNACGIWSDGKLRCWGTSNPFGEIGSGSTAKVYGMIEPDSANLYSEINVNDAIACAITQGNKLKCWGDNSNGALGVGDTTNRSSPTPVNPATDFKSVSANRFASCAITTSNKLYCWGRNTSGQIGDGSGVQQTSPVPVDAAEDYIAVSAGGSFVCGITSSNDLKCWGNNSAGTFGNGGTTNSTTPVPAAGGIKFKKISVSNTACGITTSDQAMCWGLNNYGAVGNGSSGTNVTTPYLVDSGTSYKDISTNAYYSCGVTSTNQLKCWGTLPGGLEMVQSTTRLTPTALNDGFTYASILTRQFGACGVTTDGEVACFGDSWNQNFKPQRLPEATLIDSFSTYSQVSLGEYNAIAMKTTGEVVVMGSYASSESHRYTPVIQDAGASYAGGGISSGIKITCYWNSSGAAKCNGNNLGGTLGDGTYASPTTFVSIAPSISFANIVHGDTYCAAGLAQSGALYTWPSGCGNPSAGTNLPSLTDVANTYTQLIGNSSAYYGITSAGVLKGWGTDFNGNLGGANRSSPTTLDSGTSYKMISNDSATCGITSDDDLKCWGYNTYGNLGLGDTAHRSTPTVVDSVKYKKISVAAYYSCGITIDDELKCWGRVGSDSGSPTNPNPTVVDSGVTYKELRTTRYGITAIATDGTLKFWDRARFDQTPIIMAPGVNFKKLHNGVGSSGDFCAISTSDKLYCLNYYATKATDSIFLPRIIKEFRLAM